MSDSCYSYKQDTYFTCKRSIVECCRDKTISITYSECVRVALLTQYAMFMHIITHIISFVVCMDIQYFCHITL
jgi:hypothetical protein